MFSFLMIVCTKTKLEATLTKLFANPFSVKGQIDLWSLDPWSTRPVSLTFGLLDLWTFGHLVFGTNELLDI